MGSLFRLLFYVSIVVAGLFLVAEISAHRRSPARGDGEIGAAVAESAAVVSLSPGPEAPPANAAPSASRPLTNGTTPLGIAAAIAIIALTAGVLYRLST